MGDFVVLLRGVNVGKTNRISMASLREALGRAGFQQVRIYLQSGNIVLLSSLSELQIKDAVEDILRKQFQLDVRVIVRQSSEVRALSQLNPFSLDESGKGNLYVTFLSQEIDEESVRVQIKVKDRSDLFYINGKEALIYCSGPYHLTNLSNSFWERVTKSPATTRNWNTIRKLASFLVY